MYRLGIQTTTQRTNNQVSMATNLCSVMSRCIDSITEECPGCESGCDFDCSHRDADGRYHPECCTRLAEESRTQTELHRNPEKDTVDVKYTQQCSIYECDYNILEYIERSVDGEYAQRVLDWYAKCDCCERHKKDKPTVWETYTDTMPTNNNTERCECACRHMARKICRLYSEVDESLYE